MGGNCGGLPQIVTDLPKLQQVQRLLEQQQAAQALELLQNLSWQQPDPLAVLLKGETLRRLGRVEEAHNWLANACALGREHAAPWQAGACWSFGLNLRALGRFLEAAEAFLEAVEVSPSHQLSFYALQFTRLEDEQIALLMPRLARVAASIPDLPLPQQILAEWERRCGIVEPALIRSYRAAQLATGPHQRRRLDVGAIPTPPEAIIIGGPKCGTTSLMACLSGHPRIWAHPRKELHFFDTRWSWGSAWYACQFPGFLPGSGIVRMEATPNYLQLPECPARVRQTAPESRLIIVLRDPVQRALSWFHHMERQEGLRGEPAEVIATELRELDAMGMEELAQIGWRAPNCLAGSLYQLSVPRWQATVPTDQLLVVCLEDLIANPRESMDRIHDFLGLPARQWADGEPFPKANAAPAPSQELPQGLLDQLKTGLFSEAHQIWTTFRIGNLT